MKIRNNLLYVSGGLYGQLGNVFALNHGNGWLLVDSGNPDSFQTISDNLNYWGIDVEDITHVLLTHGHDDHSGTAKDFQKFGTKVIVSKGDQEMVEAGNLGKDSPFTNRFMPAFKPDIIIDHDQNLNIGNLDFHVYCMPGHTNGSLIFNVDLDDDNILFTGDMFSCDGERGHLAMPWWKGDLNYNSEKLGESFRNFGI